MFLREKMTLPCSKIDHITCNISSVFFNLKVRVKYGVFEPLLGKSNTIFHREIRFTDMSVIGNTEMNIHTLILKHESHAVLFVV